MKIVSLTIENFRGYNEPVEIKFNDLTVFVGKNDVGKSTILEALDIFFNDGDGAVKIEKNDVNVENKKNGNLETIISVCFSDLPDRIIIDSSFETSLKDEYMLNSEGYLEIVKKYKNGGAAKTFIKANHPNNPKCDELLSAKNTDLKKIVKQEGIQCENLTVNSELRKAIWNNFKDDLQLSEKEIEIAKEDTKKIWDRLVDYMPVYSLFQADRKNSDSDDEVQDPLREAVKQILSEPKLREQLKEIANEVNQKLKDVSEKTLEKINEMDSTIANSLNPVIPQTENLKWPDVFKGVSITGDNDIPINKRGSGVKRLILLNFFRAEAERKALSGEDNYVIYAIEEPETSQHTENQLMLIEALKKLALNDKTQVILTTHSANIVKQMNFENLRLIKNSEDNKKEVLNVEPGQLNYPSLNEVNYVAFNEITEEYHNELYAYIEFKKWKEDFVTGKSTRLYKQINRDDTITDKRIILAEYIRHQIHHPENKNNVIYTKDELKESIKQMREFIKNKNLNGIDNEP